MLISPPLEESRVIILAIDKKDKDRWNGTEGDIIQNVVTKNSNSGLSCLYSANITSETLLQVK